MEQVRLLVQERFWNIVLLFVVGGFLATATELVLIGHIHGAQQIAVFCIGIWRASSTAWSSGKGQERVTIWPGSFCSCASWG